MSHIGHMDFCQPHVFRRTILWRGGRREVSHEHHVHWSGISPGSCEGGEEG